MRLPIDLTILRNGQFIKEVMTKDTPRDELIGMMIGKSAAELSPDWCQEGSP